MPNDDYLTALANYFWGPMKLIKASRELAWTYSSYRSQLITLQSVLWFFHWSWLVKLLSARRAESEHSLVSSATCSDFHHQLIKSIKEQGLLVWLNTRLRPLVNEVTQTQLLFEWTSLRLGCITNQTTQVIPQHKPRHYHLVPCGQVSKHHSD